MELLIFIATLIMVLVVILFGVGVGLVVWAIYEDAKDERAGRHKRSDA
jgi:flagellar basal body-associated protein FliL